MANTIEIKDLPEVITGSMSRSNKVIICPRCQGYGFQSKEECTSYHKGEYTTSRSHCLHCEGDGRLIETTEHMSFNLGKDKVQTMPYISFKDIVDPHGYENRWFRYRLDLTDRNLEQKYPELAAISYEKYDEMVEKYRTLEMLKKDYK
jgi:hypothetical protein